MCDDKLVVDKSLTNRDWGGQCPPGPRGTLSLKTSKQTFGKSFRANGAKLGALVPKECFDRHAHEFNIEPCVNHATDVLAVETLIGLVEYRAICQPRNIVLIPQLLIRLIAE